MDTTKSSAPAHPSTREARGIKLFKERGHEIEHPYPGLYIVPGCEAGTTYTVHLAPRVRCTCPDFERHGSPCKHVYASTIKRAKTRARVSA